jgi:predicted restriction endonuclease
MSWTDSGNGIPYTVKNKTVENSKPLLAAKQDVKVSFRDIPSNKTSSNSFTSSSSAPFSKARPSKVQTSKPRPGNKQSRYIPVKMKKIIFTKAQSRCQYVSPNGQRCNCEHQLEIDHIHPVTQGGASEIKNLRVLCRTHNQYRTQETHGFWYRPQPKKIRFGCID